MFWIGFIFTVKLLSLFAGLGFWSALFAHAYSELHLEGWTRMALATALYITGVAVLVGLGVVIFA